jgi:hypothetical protein
MMITMMMIREWGRVRFGPVGPGRPGKGTDATPGYPQAQEAYTGTLHGSLYQGVRLGAAQVHQMKDQCTQVGKIITPDLW